MYKCSNIHFKNITRRGKYNLCADEKLEKLLENNIEFGFWGVTDRWIAAKARALKKTYGGRMRDHQRVVARQLIEEIRREK